MCFVLEHEQCAKLYQACSHILCANLSRLSFPAGAAMRCQYATKVTHTQCKQNSTADGLTLSGAGLALVALHILQPLQQRQIVTSDGFHLTLGRLCLLPGLHQHNSPLIPQLSTLLNSLLNTLLKTRLNTLLNLVLHSHPIGRQICTQLTIQLTTQITTQHTSQLTTQLTTQLTCEQSLQPTHLNKLQSTPIRMINK